MLRVQKPVHSELTHQTSRDKELHLRFKCPQNMADGCAPGPLKQGIKKSKETSRKKSADYQCMMPTISECKLKAQPPASDSSGNSFDEAGETAFQVKRADGYVSGFYPSVSHQNRVTKGITPDLL